jgi:hypothetical protein
VGIGAHQTLPAVHFTNKLAATLLTLTALGLDNATSCNSRSRRATFTLRIRQPRRCLFRHEPISLLSLIRDLVLVNLDKLSLCGFWSNQQPTQSLDAETIFNESGVDADFRVESDAYASCLQVNAAENAVNFHKSDTSVSTSGFSIGFHQLA